MFKQLFAVHLLRTLGFNYSSKALGSANTIGVGMLKKKQTKENSEIILLRCSIQCLFEYRNENGYNHV